MIRHAGIKRFCLTHFIEIELFTFWDEILTLYRVFYTFWM